ncbi:isochorismatase [Fusobacterium necrophorum subsp. funduliforme]|nr:isochorismatase [Fusobacterium necrophorum subsp. funduliforme]
MKDSFDFLHTALIIVDMQNDFLLEDAPICCPGGLDIVKNIEKLARHFRTNDQPVIFTQDEHQKQDFGLQLDHENPEHCLEGTCGIDFYKDLKPYENDYIIKKRRYSAFFATDLDLLLRRLDMNTLILTGVATDVCVEATAQDAQQLGYHVIVIPECVAGTSFIAHQAALDNIKVHFGKIISLNKILDN